MENTEPHKFFEKIIDGQEIKIDKTALFGAGKEPTDEQIEKFLRDLSKPE